MEKDVIVIGAGQAGLATSYYLKQHNISHVVLERRRIGDSWAHQRWDSFMMNTPNWMTQLPGKQVPPEIRDDFMTKDAFVKYLQDYAMEFSLPVLEQHPVVRVTKEGDLFTVIANCHTWRAKSVVIAAGMMNALKLPPMAAHIPQFQLHAGDYKNPNQLPAGNILVVGAGQSGCQIAEELALAGRKVYLASSKVPRAPRRVNGKDVMEWMHLMGIMDTPTGAGQDTTQPQVSGVGPLGHTVSYQSLHQLGVTILGSMDGVFSFKDNAQAHVLFADKSSADFKDKIAAFCGQPVTETDENDIPRSCVERITATPVFSAVIWAIGFGYNFSWLAPALLDEKGLPKKTAGLHSIGFPWLRKKKSGLVFGVDEDARLLVADLLQ